MKKIYLELTTRCNLKCPMCYRNSWSTIEQDMTTETIDNLYEQIKGMNLESIVFAGIGEPTHSKNFEYAVSKFKDFNLEITTNGIIDHKKTDILLTHFNNIIISVDGINEDFYKMRLTSFKDLERTLKQIYKHKKNYRTKIPNVDFAFVLTKDNKDTIYGVIDTAKRYDATRILITHLLPQSEDQKDNIFYTRYENTEGMEYISKVNNYSYFGNRVIVVFPYMQIKTERSCPFIVNDYTYIDYLGNVIPCYRYGNDYDEYVFGKKKRVLKYKFGNINNNDLNTVYNNIEYTKFRQDVINTKHPSCVDCDFNDGCSYLEDTECDCMCYTPSCGDCLWNRNIIKCT